jgi:two-component system, OmpR family, sensor histidine kinase KdpD
MREEGRPNPEDFLAVAAKEEGSKGKGHLKVFLGMAAGVGKTYTMLEEAHAQKKESVDVAAGIVDSHGRKETAELAEGIPAIPLKKIPYKDKEFEELDVEEILARAPDLVLVDELAHTNVPGLKHAKRWEDVLEILDAGIDVYTTLNIQHIESVNDMIEHITDVSVRETVPDSVLEQAQSIRLVDITPEELLERLKEGKVYLGEQSVLAAKNFFQKDRLTALRELVLRYTAERVDRDLHDISLSQEGAKLLKPREKLLVAISHYLHSEKLIRTTRRLAWNMNAPWYALHVDTGESLNEDENNQLLKNLALARDLGGEVLSTYGPDIARGILRVARQKGATQIIIGRAHRHPILDYFRGFSILDKLAKEGSDLDLHVIRQEHHLTHQKKKLHVYLPKKEISYVYVFFWVCFLAFISSFLSNMIGYKIVGVVFLLGILASGLFFRKGPILFGAILSVFVWDFFFVPPIEAFKIASFEDRAFFVLFILTALVMGILVDRARLQKELLAKKERYTRALYDVLQKIVSSQTIEDAFSSIKESLQSYFEGLFEFAAADPKEEFNPKIGGLIADEKEKVALIWSVDNGKEAGFSTNTLPSLKNLYIPLKGFYSTVGAMVYHPKSHRFLSSEEKSFLYTVAKQMANFLERVFLEKNLQIEGLKKKEDEVFGQVLSSLSKEIKNPLENLQEAIFGAVSAFKEDAKPKTAGHLFHQIRQAGKSTQALAQVFVNVTAMAKLNQSPIPLLKERVSMHELLGSSCNKIAANLGIVGLSIKLQEHLPGILCDRRLIELLFYHLIQNTQKYSPPGSTLRIEAFQKGHEVQMMFFSIMNEEGPGKKQNPPPFLSNEMNVELKIASKIIEIHEGHLVMDFLETSGIKFIVFFPGVV